MAGFLDALQRTFGFHKIQRFLYSVTKCYLPNKDNVSLNKLTTFVVSTNFLCQSHWPRSLRRRSLAARLPRSWVRIPPGAWMFVCCECRVLSGRGLCDGLITHPEESYRLWRIVVCDLKTSKMRRLKPVTGLRKIQPPRVVTSGKQANNQCFVRQIIKKHGVVNLHVNRGLYQNYTAHNKNLTAFSADSEKQMSDIWNSHCSAAQDAQCPGHLTMINEQFTEVLRIWVLNQPNSCSINMTFLVNCTKFTTSSLFFYQIRIIIVKQGGMFWKNTGPLNFHAPAARRFLRH